MTNTPETIEQILEDYTDNIVNKVATSIILNGIKSTEAAAMSKKFMAEASAAIQAIHQGEVEAAKAQVRHDIFADLSQRMNYYDYSGAEPSKAWKKLWNHIEGAYDNAKKHLMSQPKGEQNVR